MDDTEREVRRLRDVERALRENAAQQGAYVAGVCAERQAALDEVRRLRKALEHIASADCWNSRITARDALGR